MPPSQLVLKMRCPDRPGILAAVTPLLKELGCDIREAAVYGDPQTEVFFVRMHVASRRVGREGLSSELRKTVDDLALDWSLDSLQDRMRVLIAVSKFDHCLTDILHKWRIGGLKIDIVGVVSNHDVLRGEVESRGLDFHHLPITKQTKPRQEAAFRDLIDETGAELVVLARYMQILSDDFSARLAGRCINIHHSFLPSFKGAKPYHQAHARGVKLIGATAHYVTEALDEGPIVEQDVRRVSHATTTQDMIAIGREVEASVLSRAIKWHAEHRVFLNGLRTVVL